VRYKELNLADSAVINEVFRVIQAQFRSRMLTIKSIPIMS